MMEEVQVDFMQHKIVALVHSVNVVIELQLVSAFPVQEACPQQVRNRRKSEDFCIYSYKQEINSCFRTLQKHTSEVFQDLSNCSNIDDNISMLSLYGKFERISMLEKFSNSFSELVFRV